MCEFRPAVRCLFCMMTVVGLLAGGGCRSVQHFSVSQPVEVAAPASPILETMPRELSKVVLPTYRIEPPDILMIDAINVVPRPPYRLKTLDSLSIDVQETLPDAPISGTYNVEPGGSINLGPRYGSVKVSGMTVEEAKEAIEKHLLEHLKAPVVSVTLASMGARQQITGEHLVAPDGTVTLGVYGSVPVVGLTLAEAKLVIESHLSQFLEDPEVSVDVFAYNSKTYYVITQGAGLGDGVFRFPVTGNETVLDAISQINGLEQVSSKRIWIARPTPRPGEVQILPVRWNAITAEASASTNYQILPGDRLFIAEDKLIAFDTNLGKLIAPIERIMGFTLLGATTATRLSGNVLRGGGDPRGQSSGF